MQSNHRLLKLVAWFSPPHFTMKICSTFLMKMKLLQSACPSGASIYTSVCFLCSSVLLSFVVDWGVGWGGSNRLRLLIFEQRDRAGKVCMCLPGDADCKCSPEEGGWGGGAILCLLISDKHFCARHARWPLRGIQLEVQMSASLNITALHPAHIYTWRRRDAHASPVPNTMCYLLKQA